MKTPLPLTLETLPASFPQDGSISLELIENIPLFRASQKVQSRIESLLAKQQESSLSQAEEEELDHYEELDDYLSLVNRTVRNLSTNKSRVSESLHSPRHRASSSTTSRPSMRILPHIRTMAIH